MYKFAAASKHEQLVFGAARPGYASGQVITWIEFMRSQEIQHVCCLLSRARLSRYSNLLGTYRQAFGVSRVCWSPIDDFSFAKPDVLVRQILPFLATAVQQNEKVVVHCSGGIGRTGHILAAWLVAGRGCSHKSAVTAVKKTGRNPYEAIIAAPLKGKNPWATATELKDLLDTCDRFRQDNGE